jgi:phosphonatase-like hydrolase
VIRLACLDMAGTTVADDGAVEAAFLEALPDLTPAGLDDVRRSMGESKIIVFRRLCDGDERRAQEANARFEAAYAAVVRRGEITPLPGAAETMTALRESGVKVCLTTGFSEPTQCALLDALGWSDAIDLALCPAPDRRGRPYPDMILTAVLWLELDDVREVAVAGDTINDLLSGSRAGAGIVAGVLTGAHDRATLESAPHTHILRSVAELPALIASRAAN